MNFSERPWEDMHHLAYFIHELSSMEVGEKRIIMHVDFDRYGSPISTHDVYAKGNMENILKTIPINISSKYHVVDNVLSKNTTLLMKFRFTLLSSNNITTFFLVI
jgi:hypothetical protein